MTFPGEHMGIADRALEVLWATWTVVALVTTGRLAVQQAHLMAALYLATALISAALWYGQARRRIRTSAFDEGYVKALVDTGVLHDVLTGAGTPLEPGGEREYLESLTTEGKS